MPGSALRQLGPFHGATSMGSLGGVFNEANPLEVTNTPRPAGSIKAMAEPIHGKPLVVANGWIDRPSQVGGMSTLYMDQIVPIPAQGVQTATRSAIGQSAYAPYMHYRGAHWLYSKWDPIFRYANTAMDMRFQVGRPGFLSNEQPGNIPGTARMGPYAAPYRAAWQVPRFSSEPFTIIPRSGPSGAV